MLPALFAACTPFDASGTAGESIIPSPVSEIQIYIENLKKSTPDALEVYFFDDDSLRRLDSYRHVSAPGSRFEAVSRRGDKILVVTSAGTGEESCPASWYVVRDRTVSLKDEDPHRPVLSGSARFFAGKDGPISLRLRPLLGQVTLRSLRCDFSGKPYASLPLTGVRAYLINVNDETGLLDDDTAVPHSWIHLGGFQPSDGERMAHPEMLVAAVADTVGSNTIYPGLSFYAYSHPGTEEVPGCPPTRLVLEGRIDGKTCYYPVNVPIRRDTNLILDLTVTRFGTTDPDIPAESGVVRIETGTDVFRDMGEQTIRY